jgi:hypothetical protein
LGEKFIGKNIPWNKFPCSVVEPKICAHQKTHLKNNSFIFFYRSRLSKE